MRLSPPQPVIGDEDGFEKHDTFGAKDAGERLARVVADLDEHSVIVLDGQWGSGKSVFVKQWAGLMRGRVLERMKHIFAADGVCFVLVTHLESLAEMVTHAYGLKAAARYLDKFFHLRLDIDLLLAGNNTDVRAQYIRHIYAGMGVPEPAYQYTETAIRNLGAIHNLPLRSLERVLLNVALHAKSGGYASCMCYGRESVARGSWFARRSADAGTRQGTRIVNSQL